MRPLKQLIDEIKQQSIEITMPCLCKSTETF